MNGTSRVPSPSPPGFSHATYWRTDGAGEMFSSLMCSSTTRCALFFIATRQAITFALTWGVRPDG